MVQISIGGDRVRFERADPEPARGWWHGLRLPGTQLPGVLTAGTFYQSGGAVFYDVHDPEGTIVASPEAAVAALTRALAHRTT